LRILVKVGNGMFRKASVKSRMRSPAQYPIDSGSKRGNDAVNIDVLIGIRT